MSGYLFTDHAADAELERLKLLERTFDRATRELLYKAGLAPGQTCLEVGVGAGSILRFLAERVGGAGSVVGVDRDIRFAAAQLDHPARLIQDDILTVETLGPFDLIHVRYVLVHNPEPGKIVARLAGWLKPGGRLVVEEPDFTAARHIEGGDGAAHGRVNRAIVEVFRGKGLDPACGKSLALHLHRAGLDIVLQRTEEHLCRGADGPARVMERSCFALASAYKATGLVTDDDLAAYSRNALSPDRTAVYYATVSAVAVKPPAR